MKIIFLDFDGVISTFEKGWSLDMEKLTLLRRIVDKTNCVFVVSSSWKVGCKDVEHFRRRLIDGFRTKHGVEKHEMSMIKWLCFNTFDITDSNGRLRGDEIQRWLNAHKDSVESYAILDDDSDMLESQLCNFIQTDGFEGITSREVKLCIQLLNNEIIQNPIRMNLTLVTMWRDRNCDSNNNNVERILDEYYHRFRGFTNKTHKND